MPEYMIVNHVGGLPALAKLLCGDESRWREVYDCNPNFVRVVDGRKQYRQMQVSDIINLPKGWKDPNA